MRDNKAISRLTEGYLKLLFPDLNVSNDEFIEYCVNPAVRMRQQVRDELSRLDQEYKWVSIKSELPDEFQYSHPIIMPEAVKDEEVEIDPLSAERKPAAKVIDIKEGQKGISFAKLFLPYLKGAKEITVTDPYLRYQYQIRNFFNFCECAAPALGKLKINLITGADSNEQEVTLSAEYQELKESLEPERVALKYDFDRNQHDRSIKTDTGWRIMLGRGLDIFKKPEGQFTLGFVDQTKRECKATTLTYTRSN